MEAPREWREGLARPDAPSAGRAGSDCVPLLAGMTRGSSATDVDGRTMDERGGAGVGCLPLRERRREAPLGAVRGFVVPCCC